MALDLSLLPRFQSLRSSVDWNYTLLNFIESEGSFELTIAYTALFWPDIREERGCVLLAEGFDADVFEQWWNASSGDRNQIERSMNVLHLVDLIPSENVRYDPRVVDFLGDTLAQCWRARLSHIQGRGFAVEYVPMGSPGGGTLTFFSTVE